jgi:uncharacterized protein (DUF1697 family)
MGGRRTLKESVYVGLLRGVNVGGTNKLAMADLRSLFEDLGFSGVRTFIQSGNVVFASGHQPASLALEAAIAQRFGIETDVVLRSSSELGGVVAANPFPHDLARSVHVGFMARAPGQAALEALEPERFEAERFAVVGTEAYVYLPAGVGPSKLPAYLARRLGTPITFRNWSTVNRLLELSAG